VLVDDYHTELAERVRERIEAGDRTGGVEAFFETVGTMENVGQPVVDRAAKIVETIAREVAVVERYDLEDPETGVPTLLVEGAEGPLHLKRSLDVLEAELADVERVVLPDVGHVGFITDAEVVADAVREFAG
jgi:pimeloyl-ACP methyl ester carboxylesterase